MARSRGPRKLLLVKNPRTTVSFELSFLEITYFSDKPQKDDEIITPCGDPRKNSKYNIGPNTRFDCTMSGMFFQINF